MRDLDRIKIINTDSGYNIKIFTKNGKKISATENFPGILKSDPDNGLADHVKYAYGTTEKNGEQVEFKKSFNILSEIVITEVKEDAVQ